MKIKKNISTREQQIKLEAMGYSHDAIYTSPYEDFIAGAKWADRHPDKIFVTDKLSLKNTSENKQIIERLKSCVYAADLTTEGRNELIVWLENVM